MKKRIPILLVLSTLALAGAVRADEAIEDWRNQPATPFHDGEANFKKVKQMLLERAYDPGLTEDQLYAAATDGMLRALNENTKNVYNKLLTPTEMEEMKVDLKGEFTGIGVEIKFDADLGLTTVIGLTPNSPAEKDGVKVGDQIVSIDGKISRGLQFRDVVYAIRGKPGGKVKLRILRGDSLITKEVTREALPVSSVSAAMFGRAGFVSVSYFNEKTADRLEGALKMLADKGMTSLILDLRGNSGGLFDGAVSAAGLLLPKDSVVVRLEKRGGEEEAIRSTRDPVVIGSLPIAVLVNEDTASSAELFTETLVDNLGAKVIGTRTHGKWNVQTIEDLPNGYAVRFTTGNFKSPRGHSFPDVGIEPDVQVATTAGSGRFRPDGEDLQKRLSNDPPLRAAVSLFYKKGAVSSD